jgi:predicted nucleotidyltransferase component of viral defense system
MRNHPSNLEASILHRLRNCARKMNADPKLIHLWYGIERFLYRLSQSKYREKFVLKGALLFRVWEAEVFRPTRDIDVLAFLDTDAANLRQVITEIADMQGIDDGLTFDRNSIRMEIIRQTQE